MLVGKGAGRLKELLTVAGLSLAELDTDDLLGKELNVTIAYGRDQQGEVSKYAEIKALSAIQ